MRTQPQPPRGGGAWGEGLRLPLATFGAAGGLCEVGPSTSTTRPAMRRVSSRSPTPLFQNCARPSTPVLRLRTTYATPVLRLLTPVCPAAPLAHVHLPFASAHVPSAPRCGARASLGTCTPRPTHSRPRLCLGCAVRSSITKGEGVGPEMLLRTWCALPPRHRTHSPGMAPGGVTWTALSKPGLGHCSEALPLCQRLAAPAEHG